MMDWMYSPDNLMKQLSEGHVYYIAIWNSIPCGYVSVQPDGTNGFYMNDYIMGLDLSF